MSADIGMSTTQCSQCGSPLAVGDRHCGRCGGRAVGSADRRLTRQLVALAALAAPVILGGVMIVRLNQTAPVSVVDATALPSRDASAPPTARPVEAPSGNPVAIAPSMPAATVTVTVAASVTPPVVAEPAVPLGPASGCTTSRWRQGARDACVGYLQTLANYQLGLFGGSAIDVDGIFGVQTASAVTSVQAHRGLDIDGIVGPQTWSALCQFTALPGGVTLPDGFPLAAARSAGCPGADLWHY